ncbi:hypothetical protein [Kitasatospora kazusensis]|uniref:hypothetical protein n=1 Tax=Kitasatospora kazusensis TaxID=407974 RepID=UPI0031D6EEE0
MRVGKNTRTPASVGEGPVTVEIGGVTGPATFARLPDALAALWQSLRPLPLGAVQYDAYEYFLNRPDSSERVAEFLKRDGELQLTFAMGGVTHVVRVRPAATGAG